MRAKAALWLVYMMNRRRTSSVHCRLVSRGSDCIAPVTTSTGRTAPIWTSCTGLPDNRTTTEIRRIAFWSWEVKICITGTTSSADTVIPMSARRVHYAKYEHDDRNLNDFGFSLF